MIVQPKPTNPAAPYAVGPTAVKRPGVGEDGARAKPALVVTRATGGGATVLRLRGALDVSSTSILRAALDGAGRSSRMVVLDMAGVSFVDSSGIGAIVGARQSLENDFCDLVIANPSATVRRVLDLVGLQDLLVRADSA